MKTRFSRILSGLCALAMMPALLPGAFAEGGEVPEQNLPAESVSESAEEPDAANPETSGEEAPAEEPGEEPPAEEPAAEEPIPEEPAAEETVPEEPAAEEAGAENAGTDQPAPEEPAAEASGAEETPSEEPAAEEPAAEEPAAEDPGTEETPSEEPAADEIPELVPGKSLKAVIPAGREYSLLLKGTEADTILLTLILEKGRTVTVRIRERVTEFTEYETQDSAWSVYTCECRNIAWTDCPVSLSAAEDTDFQLQAETVPEQAEAQPLTEEPGQEPADGETPAETGEDLTEEQPGTETPAEGGPSGETPSGEEPDGETPDETEEDLTEEEPGTETPAEEEPGTEVPAEEEPDESEPAESDPADEPATDPTAEAPTEDLPEITEAEQEMLDAGYVRAIVIREHGTALYADRDNPAEAAGSLACGEVIWAKPTGDMWGEFLPEGQEEPLYFNMNNVSLQLGEIGYEVPARTVKLTSTLEGVTEIQEGTWIVLTAECSGFTADEIEAITWQYRSPEDGEEFSDVAGAEDLTYIYPVSPESIHYEWRILLTLKS